MGWSGRRWALRRRVPLATSFHTNFPAYVGGYGLGLLERPVWSYLRFFHDDARVTFCPSDPTRALLLDHGFHERIRVRPQILDAVLEGWTETSKGDPSLLQSSTGSVTTED
ncbi:MAG: glycosyltransferase [Longimicrobiales bacterium]|nr:glycosyltransferase [Longimicrobiales bacterium]